MAVNSIVVMWATAISTHTENGRKIIWRFAEALAPAFDRTSQPIRINIVWKYRSETGVPVTEERERMDVLEDKLKPLVEQDRFPTLVLVSTGENIREWTYYAESEHGFAARFDYAITDMPELPIEVHCTYDPTWDMYGKFRAGVNETVID